MAALYRTALGVPARSDDFSVFGMRPHSVAYALLRPTLFVRTSLLVRQESLKQSDRDVDSSFQASMARFGSLKISERMLSSSVLKRSFGAEVDNL